MTRKLVRGGLAFALLLGLAVITIRHHSLATPPPTADEPKYPPQPALRFLPTPPVNVNTPELKHPMACYKVREKKLGSGFDFSGTGYLSEVSESGLRFETGGYYVELRSSSLERGDRSIPLEPARVEKNGFAKAAIHRGPLVEEYVFENLRGEQVYRISEAPGDGPLVVRAAVQTNLTGPILEVPRYAQGWKDPMLADGGLAFTDESGDTRIAYHGAVALDQAGKKLELNPSYRNGEIVLEVPATFMADAKFPVVIDPWLDLNFSGVGVGISNATLLAQTPAIAVGGSNPYVAWSEQISASQFQIYFVFWNGLGWFPLGGSNVGTGVSATAGNATNPTIAVDSAANVYIAWEDDSNSGNHEIYMKQWNGANWVQLANSATGGGVSSSVGFSTFPSIALMEVPIPLKGVSQIAPVIAYQDNSGPTSLDAIYVVGFFPGDAGQAPSGPGAATVVLNYPPIPAGWYGLGLPQGPVQNIYVSQIVAGVARTGASGTPAGAVSQAPKLVMFPSGVPGRSSTGVVLPDPTGADYTPNLATAGFAFICFQDTRTGGSIFDIFAMQYIPPFPSDVSTWPTFPVVKNPDFCSGQWVGAAGQAVLVADNVSATPAAQSLHPSIGLDSTGTKPVIAWEEYVGPTAPQILANSEIFVKALTPPAPLPTTGTRSAGAGAWGALGTSTTTSVVVGGSVGGISNTLATSVYPSVALDSADVPFVAWSDADAGNAEIYVRSFTAGAWNQVGFNSFSATPTSAVSGVGGISQNAGASLSPAMMGGPIPAIAWQDYTNGVAQIYVRAFYQNRPVAGSIVQTHLGAPNPSVVALPANPPPNAVGALPTDIIAFGTVTAAATIELRCRGMSEDVARVLRMEVEVQPVGAPFVGTITQVSPPLPVDSVTHLTSSAPVGGIARELTVAFTGLINTSYHWRVRVVDDLGRFSTWFEADPGTTVAGNFAISAVNNGTPTAPIGVAISPLVGPGGTVVTLSWTDTSGAVTYNINRSTSSGTETPLVSVAGTNLPGNFVGMDTIPPAAISGTVFFYTITGSRPGPPVVTGPPSAEVTFTVAPAGAPVGGNQDTAGKSRCGSTGLELLGVAALAYLIRRGRRK
jgi:hypothetical protein